MNLTPDPAYFRIVSGALLTIDECQRSCEHYPSQPETVRLTTLVQSRAPSARRWLGPRGLLCTASILVR